MFVNAGRGSAVDLDALIEALRSGRLAGATIDVTDPEPLPAEHPAWDTENLVITPHVAGGVRIAHALPLREHHTLRCMVELFRENFARYREGRPLRNLVPLS